MIVDRPLEKKFVIWKPGETLKVIKSQIYECALANHGGNVTYAANELGISRRALRIWKSARRKRQYAHQTEVYKNPLQAERKRGA